LLDSVRGSDRRRRREAEEAQAEAELRFGEVFDSAPIGMAVMDLDGRWLGVNRVLCQITGYSEEQLLGLTFQDITHPEDLEADLDLVRQLLAGEIPSYRLERRYLRPDGSVVRVLLGTSLIRDQEGSALHFVSHMEDVTAQRRAETFLATQHAVTRALADSTTLDEALERVLREACEGLGFRLAAIWAVDDDLRRLRCAHVWSAECQAGVDRRAAKPLAPGAGIPGQVWRSGQPLAAEDASEGLGATVAVPVCGADGVIGVIEGVGAGEGPVGEDLIQVVSDLSGQVGQFIERKRAERREAQQAENMAVVAQVSRDLAGAGNLERARPAICETALAAAEANLAVLWEPDPAGVGLRVTATAGGPVPEGLTNLVLPFWAEASGVLEAFTAAEPLFLTDLAGDPSTAGQMVGASGIVSCLWQPVLRGDVAIAVLVVSWDRRVASLDDRVAAVTGLLAQEAAVIIERSDLFTRLRSMARRDDLTGLPNRHAFGEELPRELARGERDARPVSVVMLDMDGFSNYAERYGPVAAELLLRDSATAWRDALRLTDVLARHGHQRFAVILSSLAGETSLEVAQRLRGLVPEGETCSAGVATWDGSEESDALLGRAEAALERAKRAGRDRAAAAA